MVSWITTTAPGRAVPGEPRHVHGQAAAGRPLPVEFLAVRAGRRQPLLDDLLERRAAGPPPTSLRPDRRGRVEPEQLARPGRWRTAPAGRASMAITPSTMPDRMVRELLAVVRELGEGGGQPAAHRVERLGQVGVLPAAGDADRVAEVALGQSAGPVGQFDERAGEPAGQQVRRDRRPPPTTSDDRDRRRRSRGRRTGAGRAGR